jgi:hypothetical protein
MTLLLLVALSPFALAVVIAAFDVRAEREHRKQVGR